MGRHAESDKIILLFEQYALNSQHLYESFLRSGCEFLTVVMEENDFLPDNIVSLYDLVLGNYRDGQMQNSGEPKYFNEIEIPDTWSISAENKGWGRITYQREDKGRIYYAEPVQELLVKAVDWYDRNGTTRFRDHYNRFGNLCARTVYDAEGMPVSKSWLTSKGQEVLTKNYATGAMILDDGNVVKMFRTKIDLAVYYLRKLGFDQNRIFFNTLSEPFFLSNRLGGGKSKKDALFWQETVENEIPGNLCMILEGRALRTGKIMVQTRKAYQRLLELGAAEDQIQKLGFIYPFERENGYGHEALICTDSDRIEHCEELIRAFPQIQFHIAALTWMSQKLFHLEQYKNVSLYPGAKPSILNELFQKCDYYFDINYRAEIASAVYRAFLNNQLIFAFQETVHNRDYVADIHIYPVTEFERMVSEIRKIIDDKSIMDQHLKKQQEDALAETRESYIQMLEL